MQRTVQSMFPQTPCLNSGRTVLTKEQFVHKMLNTKTRIEADVDVALCPHQHHYESIMTPRDLFARNTEYSLYSEEYPYIHSQAFNDVASSPHRDRLSSAAMISLIPDADTKLSATARS